MEDLGTLWNLGQFGTAHVGGTILHCGVIEDNLAPRAIGHHNVKEVNLASGQFGTTVLKRTIWDIEQFGTIL